MPILGTIEGLGGDNDGSIRVEVGQHWYPPGEAHAVGRNVWVVQLVDPGTRFAVRIDAVRSRALAAMLVVAAEDIERRQGVR